MLVKVIIPARYKSTRFPGKSLIDINGKLVQSITNIGSQSVKWNGENSDGIKVRPGIYFIRIKSDSEIVLKKVTMLK